MRTFLARRRPGGPEAPVGGASRWRLGLLWLMIISAITVTGVSAVAITELQRKAERAGELQDLLNDMKVAAWQQSTLTSQAVMAHALTPAAERRRDEIDEAVDAIGNEFEDRDPGSAQARAVQAAYIVYDTAVDEEFDLFAENDIAGAQRIQAERSDPAFQALTAELERADRHYQEAADRAGTRAQVGTALILAAAALIMVVLVGQSHRVRSRAFRRATFQASHDALTGLPNRVMLHERIAAAADPAGEQIGAALLLIDLDRFKEVNDTLGHHYGDQLLIQVARRMQGVLRRDEMVARLGGDEFAILLPGVTESKDVASVADRLHDALDQPFPLDGINLTVGGSIGAALCPEHGNTADELLQRADIAMYAAKTNRTGYMLFNASQDSSDPRKLTLASELRRGIEQGELVLHYQPKVDAQTSEVLGAEALVRWQHPEHGMIPPDEFIPLAEHTGLITPLTRFVLDAAIQQCRSWRLGGHEIPVAVNVSTHRLLDLAFPAEVANLLARWELPARLLTLEITESAIMADPDRALEVVQQLHALGVSLSIDDFGTGYSSMAYLKNLPVDELKIDRSFVSSMTTNERDAVIVRSTVELGRNLGLHVIAEGVEDIATWNELDAVGCHAIQGYYVSRPVTPGQLEEWLNRQPTTAPGSAVGAGGERLQ
ncbi:EAL domain-containing protein [Actinoplanes sp. TBRC 11911]|uniref:putative bifunctional diguanylate cyclase/phosphodiesterase n=1 Tax=Actinoplanes sp. TBRC 11911 TaxID=2729386 RepID=UPI00145FA2BE|nr:EAL domain-containing protein [Actinoplanes sp. TBRC 11911]NMO52348.1 EAL domain-containing protein [Actinoplanes sp. TBRC 11911]